MSAPNVIQDRRAALADEMKKLVADAEHWNRTHPDEEPIVIDVDITADVEQARRAAAGLSVYRIQDCERHWVIAASEREALDLLKEACMLDDYATVEEYVEEQTPVIVALGAAETVTLSIEDGPTKETHTAEGWCVIHGKGFLGSTAF